MKKVTINFQHYYNNFQRNDNSKSHRNNRPLRNGYTRVDDARHYSRQSYFGILHKPEGSDSLDVIENYTSCREVLAKQWYLYSLGAYQLIRSLTNSNYQNIPLSFKDTNFGEDRSLFLAISFMKKDNLDRFLENVKIITKIERALKVETSKFMVEDFEATYERTLETDYVTIAVKPSKYWTSSVILFSIFTLLLRDMVWIDTKDLKIKDIFAGRFTYIPNFGYKSTRIKAFVDANRIDLWKFLKNSDFILGNQPDTGINDSVIQSVYTSGSTANIFVSSSDLEKFPVLKGYGRGRLQSISTESAYYNGIMALSRLHSSIVNVQKGRVFNITPDSTLSYGILWLLRYEQLIQKEQNVRKEKRTIHKEL